MINFFDQFLDGPFIDLRVKVMKNVHILKGECAKIVHILVVV